MRWTGIIVLLFLDLPPDGSHVGQRQLAVPARRSRTTTSCTACSGPASRSCTSSRNMALAIHLYHGSWSMFQSLGITNPRYNTLRRRFAQGFAGVMLVGNVSFPIAVQLHLVDLKCPHRNRPPPRARRTRARPTEATMTLDSKIPDRSDRREVGQPQVRDQARQPGEQAPLRDRRGRHRPGRGVGGRDASASSATA